jgi:hypothetical protein
MAMALEGYLEESGLAPDKLVGELGRYFVAPAAYEQALRERLIDHLTRRGQQQLAVDDRAAALDVFDRVLTIDPSNAKVLDILGGINRRRRMRMHAVATAVAGTLAVCAWMIHRNAVPPESDPPPRMVDPPGIPAVPPRHTEIAHIELPAIPLDADATVAVAEPDAAPAARAPDPARPPDAPKPAAAAVATQIRVSPAKDAEYVIGNGLRKPVPDDGVIRLDLTVETEVHVFSLTRCCQEESKLVAPGADVTIVMPYLPGGVLPLCPDHPGAEVQIGGVSGNLGRTFAIPIGDSTDETKPVVVEFLGEHIDPTPIKITVEAGKTREVKCTSVR